MNDNVVRREVQRRDDPFGIPACFYWTVDEVADWVDSIGYGKYKENFRSHFINGRKLLTTDACVLPKIGITHFGDILSLCKIIECLGKNRTSRGQRPEPPKKFAKLSEVMERQNAVKEDQCCVEQPWWEQPRHQTLIDYVSTVDGLQRARLAGRRQYYMGP